MDKKLAPAIVTKDLSLSLRGNTILQNLSFSVERGSLLILFGPNGAGKTSLLRILCGIQKANSGSVLIAGQDIGDLSRNALSRQVCYIPQQHSPAFAYSVFDFVLMGRTVYTQLLSVPGAKDREIVRETLENLGIAALSQCNYAQLSSGERQLVLIARGMVQSSPLLLLDEPISNLDYQHQHAIMGKVQQLVREKNKTAIISLHDPNLAMRYGDRILGLSAGNLIADLDTKGGNFIREMEIFLKTLYKLEIKVRNIGSEAVVLNAAGL